MCIYIYIHVCICKYKYLQSHQCIGSLVKCVVAKDMGKIGTQTHTHAGAQAHPRTPISIHLYVNTFENICKSPVYLLV